MRFLAHAASVLVLLCSVTTIDAAPIDDDAVTAPLGNQTVTEKPESLAAAPILHPVCTRNRKIFPIWRSHYEIKIPNLPETEKFGHVCDRLWQQLKTWPLCQVSSPHGCSQDIDRTLFWNFHTSPLCNKGMVEAAFWGATDEAKWGHIKPCASIGWGS